jgi:hypothetical protein
MPVISMSDMFENHATFHFVICNLILVLVAAATQKRKFHEINTRRITSGLIAADIRVNGGASPLYSFDYNFVFLRLTLIRLQFWLFLMFSPAVISLSHSPRTFILLYQGPLRTLR